ncbi:DUF1002 domain-containing protein [Bacillus horti]|uniref:Uncharacterized protein YpuA (DUF1002 family) n=1 Tax=Caldalkalibacillus horti TaxID=77523 RepID=A0ABT9W214_9BACI|nr:DUF1002 domain-containing protein [Bacillus horti]MDQ0167261.1 uncharacterized protein YpuA (DUF1002 family) [Bacillus horti]
MIFLNKRVKNTMIYSALLSMLLFVFPIMVSADAIEGTTVVTLGENLTQEQQNQLLREMGVADDVEIIYVSNAEEHQYLGSYIDSATIGTRAISSAKITLTPEGAGLNVDTNNITRITEAMYLNALVTAGVQDADVYVTAPFGVSGTAGLTGVMKAFEVATDTTISEEQKQVANEEMVRTSELGEKFGTDKATELMTRLKEELGDTKLETDEDYRNLILRIAGELNINLNDDDVNALVHLLKRLKGLNIDWNQVGNQLKNIRDNIGEILDREETRNFIRQFLDFVIQIVDSIKSWFSS